MDAARKKPADGGSASTTVLGERTRTSACMAVAGFPGKRPQSVALEIALAVDSEVGKEHAQW